MNEEESIIQFVAAWEEEYVRLLHHPDEMFQLITSWLNPAQPPA
jgi:hypothetical protein